MALFQDPITKEIIEVSEPSLNPQLVAGKVRVPESARTSAFAQNGAITTDDIRPSDEIRPQALNIPPVADISTIQIPEILPTESEQAQSSTIKRLQELEQELAGKPTFEAEKIKEAGVVEAETAVSDLQTRIRDLQRQQQLVPEVLELESLGRGRTVGGVAPLEIGKRRAIAVETLTTSSLLDAAQGRLTSALRKVDQAVNERFAPIEAQIAAQKANLNLIKQDPNSTIQELNRANKLEQSIRRQEEQQSRLKEEQKAILGWANKATSELAEAGELTPERLAGVDEITKVKTATVAAQKYSDLIQGITKGGQIIEPRNLKQLATSLGVNEQSVSKAIFKSGLSEEDFSLLSPIDQRKFLFGEDKLTGGEGAPRELLEQTPFGISPITQKPFTADQSRAATFASRIKEAELTLSQGRGFFVPFVPKFFRSEDRRSFEQAEKNFITAVLRRESGAAIAESEFDDAKEVYIPKATDDKNTLALKALARKTALQGLINESVGAFNQLQSSLSGVDSSILKSGSAGVTKTGLKFTVE